MNRYDKSHTDKKIQNILTHLAELSKLDPVFDDEEEVLGDINELVDFAESLSPYKDICADDNAVDYSLLLRDDTEDEENYDEKLLFTDSLSVPRIL